MTEVFDKDPRHYSQIYSRHEGTRLYRYNYRRQVLEALIRTQEIRWFCEAVARLASSAGTEFPDEEYMCVDSIPIHESFFDLDPVRIVDMFDTILENECVAVVLS